MKRYSILLLCAMVFASCVNRENLFDPNGAKEEAKKNFPIENIDPNQTWATRGVRTLDVTVNEKTGQTYTIKVFTANPFCAEDNPRLLAESRVTDGVPSTIKFDAALTLEHVFVMRKIDAKDYIVTVASLENNKFTAYFGDAPAARAVKSARGVTIDEAVYTCPEGAISVTSDFDGKEPGNYVVKAGTTVTLTELSFKGAVHLYVEGTLIIEEKKGKDNDNDVSLHLSKEVEWVSVLEGGTLILKEDLKIQHGIFYNAGTVLVDDVDMTGGTWVNAGRFTAEDFTVQTGNAVLQNDCVLLINEAGDDGEFELSGNSAFNNSGYVECGEASIGNNATLNMTGKGVFRAQETEFQGASKITGPASSESPYPLFSSDVLIDKNEKLQVTGRVYVSSIGVGSSTSIIGKFTGGLVGVSSIIAPNIDECHATVSGTDDPTEDTPMDGTTFAFEDVSVDTETDYDFNDVVLFVTNPNEKNEIQVVLVAAGAINEVRVGYNIDNSDHLLWNGQEVHELFANTTGHTGAMFNTSGGIITKNLPQATITVPEGFSVFNDANFYIEINEAASIYARDNGYVANVPFALRVSGEWQYPTERTRIDEAYSGFGKWGVNMETNPDWYKNATGNTQIFNYADLSWD